MSRALLRERSHVRRLATVLLAAGWLFSLLVPHAGDDDRLCVPRQVDDGQGASFAASAGVQQPEHCAICHAARSFRALRSASTSAAVSLVDCSALDVAASLSHRAPAHDRLPARAPPTASI